MTLKQAMLTGSATENLDRGVILASMAGLTANGVEYSLTGATLTFLATIVYGIVRNRIENLNQFQRSDIDTVPALPGVNLTLYTLLCQWLGSKELYYGLLGDAIDSNFGCSAKQINRYLRVTLIVALCQRTKEKLLTLFWLDGLLR